MKNKQNPLTYLRAKLRSVVCPMGEVCSSVPERCSVFDLGCGTGAMLLDLIKTRGVKSVGGCEISESLLDAARQSVSSERGTSGKFLQTSSPPPCIADFDCITLIDVLHHIPRDMQISYLEQVARHMKSGAILVLKDIDASNPLVWFNRLHDALFSGNGFQEIGSSAAQQLVTQAGLCVESTKKIRKLWYPHYFILARKF
jgi:cyclopropane fatty-acyl-phospholipid synthase-like methyltransferase